jgi:hypothetical protein
MSNPDIVEEFDEEKLTFLLRKAKFFTHAISECNLKRKLTLKRALTLCSALLK